MSRIAAALVAAPFLLAVAVSTAVGAHADQAPSGPPYVDHTEWAHWGDLSSLRVYPTPSARASSGLGAPAAADEAWTEVLGWAPDADIPGMREQFLCHWDYAEYADPGKTSWNLEPWRPVVSTQEMVDAGCNPGGTQEPF